MASLLFVLALLVPLLIVVALVWRHIRVYGRRLILPTQGNGWAPVYMWRRVLAGWLRRGAAALLVVLALLTAAGCAGDPGVRDTACAIIRAARGACVAVEGAAEVCDASEPDP